MAVPTPPLLVACSHIHVAKAGDSRVGKAYIEQGHRQSLRPVILKLIGNTNYEE